MAPWGNKRIRRTASAVVFACALTVGTSSAVAAAPPAAPVLTGTSPSSPANANHVSVLGTAEPGSTVNIYPDGDCSGPPYPSGTAASLASPGIEVQVPDDSKNTFSATATNATPETSTCSAPITYVEDSRPPQTIIGRMHLNRRKGTITPVFSSDEPYTTFQCHWTRWGRCLPGQRSWHVGHVPSRHRYFGVRATDAAGNVDPTPAVKPVTYNPLF
jgi:hypothetical protein